jgi:hypothetical protein
MRQLGVVSRGSVNRYGKKTRREEFREEMDRIMPWPKPKSLMEQHSLKSGFQARLTDCAFLLAVILISAVPYVQGLGLYSDDWAYQSQFAQRASWGSFTLLRNLVLFGPNLRVRPVQAAYLVLGFRGFGGNGPALGVLGAAVLSVAALFLYLVLRELNLTRSVALSAAALYGLLPQYSVVRFWYLTGTIGICVAFALLGIYAMLRSAQPQARHPSVWIAVSIVAFVLSFLSFEVAVGLIVAAVAMFLWRRYRVARASGRGPAALAGVWVMVAALLIVGVIKTRMQNRIVYNHHFLRFVSRLGAIALHAGSQAIQFNFWAYLLHMPWVVARLWQNSALTAIAIATAVVIACAVSVYLWWNIRPDDALNWRTCLALIAAGLALFFLGIVLFVRDLTWDYAAPGEGDRISVAAALGAALILVALTGLLCSAIKWPVVRVRVFSILIGAACGLNSLAVSGIGYYWDDAATKQKAILQSLDANVRGLPQKSVLLLDGFCRYSGPAPVFETDWDTSGAIEIALGDSTLRGDVISPNAHFEAAAVSTTLYGATEGYYPYGDHLFIYNLRSQSLEGLTSQEAAMSYVQKMNPTGDSGCPPAGDGEGVRVF